MNKLLAVFLSLILFPSLALAHNEPGSAGTDAYLRHEIALSEAELSTPLATENRQPFELAAGETTIDDPLGDVLNRAGNTSPLTEPWGDISKASVAKNESKQTWDVVVTLGGTIPAKPTDKAELFFYADHDGDTSNNMTGGIKDRMDVEFAVQYNAENGWYSDFRWYNPAPVDFWAVDRETAATFSFGHDSIIINIPFSEIGPDVDLKWRVVMAIAEGANTEIDAAPGVGFPAPLDTSPAGTTEPKGGLDLFELPTTVAQWLIWIIPAGIIIGAIIYAIRVARRRKAGPRP